jgi:hypothetical protein
LARAKQTARSEARRRARLANRPLETDVEAVGAETDDETTGPSSASRTGTGAARPVGQRPGFGSFFSSFGTAYRRANIREDLRLLPGLLLSRGFLAAIAMVLIGGIAFAIWPGYSGSTIIFQFFTYPPALAPIFIAGYFAPRASYLLGLLVGLFDAAVYSVWLVAALPTFGTAADPSQLGVYVVTYVFWSGVTGVVFAAGAAWYRRFLQSTSPRRQAQARGQARGQSRAQPARGKATAAAASSGRRRS